MTDWNQLFKTDEFRAYRKAQINAVASVIEKDMLEAVNRSEPGKLAEVEGKLSMAKALLKLPETLTKDKAVRDLLEHQTIEDTAELTRVLIRKRLNPQKEAT